MTKLKVRHAEEDCGIRLALVVEGRAVAGEGEVGAAFGVEGEAVDEVDALCSLGQEHRVLLVLVVETAQHVDLSALRVSLRRRGANLKPEVLAVVVHLAMLIQAGKKAAMLLTNKHGQRAQASSKELLSQNEIVRSRSSWYAAPKSANIVHFSGTLKVNTSDRPPRLLTYAGQDNCIPGLQFNAVTAVGWSTLHTVLKCTLFSL